MKVLGFITSFGMFLSSHLGQSHRDCQLLFMRQVDKQDAGREQSQALSVDIDS